MKKMIIIFLLIFVTGCSIVRIDTSSIDNIVSVVLSKNNTLYNRVGNGYKYYIPRGVSYIETSGTNETLYFQGNYYYLYIDIVSYLYQMDIPYEEDSSIYYSKKIDNDHGKGYLEITKRDDLYYVKFYGEIHYMHIYILKSVKFR